jgi:hypothetical protein
MTDLVSCLQLFTDLDFQGFLGRRVDPGRACVRAATRVSLDGPMPFKFRQRILAMSSKRQPRCDDYAREFSSLPNRRPVLPRLLLERMVAWNPLRMAVGTTPLGTREYRCLDT